MGKNFIRQCSLVPRIKKSQFDDVASEFLEKYCPEALRIPMAVPIMEIARKKMGLRIIDRFRLTEDFSVYGMICFNSGLVPIYDKDEDEYRDIKVRRGTILIDADTLTKRNVGCLHNTVAHECVHWYKHSEYHFYQNGIGKSTSIAYRYPSVEKDERFQTDWNDEDWMEWQANGIAPRILMPKQTFVLSFNRTLANAATTVIPQQWVVNKLAEFYQVSKQSAGIRCEELGLSVCPQMTVFKQ